MHSVRAAESVSAAEEAELCEVQHVAVPRVASIHAARRPTPRVELFITGVFS